MSFRIKKNWEIKYPKLSAAGLSTSAYVPGSGSGQTGDYALYELRRDVATLLVDNLTEADLSAYMYNTDGMGISVLPEGFTAISGNCSTKQFAIKDDRGLYVRNVSGVDTRWYSFNTIPENSTMLSGGVYIASEAVTPIMLGIFGYNYHSSTGGYVVHGISLTAHAPEGVVPKVLCLSGGGYDDYWPLCVIEHNSGNRRLVGLFYQGDKTSSTYRYYDLVSEASGNSAWSYPHLPTKTDYIACSGSCGYHDNNAPIGPYSGDGDKSGWQRCFGAAISASGGVDVMSLSDQTKQFFYALDRSTVFKHVSGGYIAPYGYNGTLQGSIYVATDNDVKYVKIPDGRMHDQSAEPDSDMYTVSVTGLPSNYKVIKLVGGTGTTDPAIVEGTTDNIVIIRKG